MATIFPDQLHQWDGNEHDYYVIVRFDSIGVKLQTWESSIKCCERFGFRFGFHIEFQCGYQFWQYHNTSYSSALDTVITSELTATLKINLTAKSKSKRSQQLIENAPVFNLTPILSNSGRCIKICACLHLIHEASLRNWWPSWISKG